MKFLAAALALHVMSRAELTELMVLFVVGSALTLAVFFLALWLLPFERFPPFSSPRFSPDLNAAVLVLGLALRALRRRGSLSCRRGARVISHHLTKL